MTGSCLACDKPTTNQSYCDYCEDKPPKEEEVINYCPVCEDEVVELKDQICEVCIETAHDDNKCFDNCPICSNERDRERGER